MYELIWELSGDGRCDLSLMELEDALWVIHLLEVLELPYTLRYEPLPIALPGECSDKSQ